ncbi:unnamed protein product [Caenorhabditis angaria]|uniref:Alcohol dehydrogenase-like C-terminal domain-containing protein n=1 Tax=Caenorhabditis angaria TaxID=860376 RepID=A0A9P1IET3_9PELO|nr:unnamed protein product [Caenorhabditis angaria]
MLGERFPDQVIARMNPKGRVILCGQIAVYNTDLPYPPPIPCETQKILETRQIQRDRYLVLNYKNDWQKGIAQLRKWMENDEIRVKETIYEGLQNGPAAFVDMMNGKNVGKMLIRV